ncbi:RagB/SusD family nutrient uptake outer membrane protein [Rufibacter sp. LB8]|uniref:RagB/SusD family nutrient uptake outer membrane protein n=1 Tax=Rufibacter sp. LB8 TaxID=2777781 RepID=UPI00178C6E07|nr:RagB/SusD family nutrient uptake outer membrane protein [Rufibacter sp. LB8]
MKRYRFLSVLALAGSLTVSSCDDLLDIPPKNVSLQDDIFKDPANAQLILASTYEVLRAGNFMGGSSWVFSELLADNINGTGITGDWNEYYSRNSTIFNGSTRSFWADGYRTIYRANVLIANIDQIQGLPDAERNRIKGEALFLRAISHFEIVRLFAQPYGFTTDNSHLGIPLRLTPTQEPLLRATVAQVYNQIIADLTEASTLIPPVNNNYASGWSAKGYLAKVHFQMNSFQKAYDFSDDVLKNSPFRFEQDFKNRFKAGGSTEDVFALVSTGLNSNSSSRVQDHYRSDNNRRPNVRVAADLLADATSNPNDKRGQEWFRVVNPGTPNEEVFITKYNGPDFFNVPLLSVTELKLIRAESAAELNRNLPVAIADLNDIRTRAYGAGNNTVSATANARTIIDIARQERRIELATEGVRLHDLKRIAVRENPTLRIRGAVWNCPGLIIQFPDDEVSANPNFQRNPEGGCAN